MSGINLTLAAMAAMAEDKSLGYQPEKDTQAAPTVKRIALGAEKKVRGAKAEKIAKPVPQPVDAPKAAGPIDGPKTEIVRLDLTNVDDAATFVARLKLCGFRPLNDAEGNPRIDSSGAPIMGRTDYATKRGDEIALLKTVTTYDPKAIHGVSLSNAERIAKLTLAPHLGAERKRSDPSIQGFVAGAVDHIAKRRSHLQAEERKIVDLLGEAEHALLKLNPGEGGYEQSKLMVQGYREALAATRADLSKLD